MINIKDYQIIQRDENGQAKAYFCGVLPEDTPERFFVAARVFGEQDHLTIVDYVRCSVENGCWEVEMTLPEGGLYSFEAKLVLDENENIHCSRRIHLVRHFGVGDLYLITGQSNMAGYGREVANDPPTLGVHLYANNGKWTIASHPLNDSIDTIYPENREDGTGTSPALSFARTLNEKLNIPIGLIQAALGGSPLSAWHPEEEAYLYRGMMRRMDVVGKVKGVLWYQGCSDTNMNCSQTYYDRFKRMVELWRQQLGNIPFITVQLNRLAAVDVLTIENDRYWGILRDAQRRLADDVPGIYIVSVLDVPMSDGIHNSSSANTIIGTRMAMVALKHVYQKPGLSAPSIQNCYMLDEKHVKATFDAEYCFVSMGYTAYDIDVEDEKGIIPCVRVDCKGGALLFETQRPYTLPAKFHAYWRCTLTSMPIRDYVGMPLLSCYNVDIIKQQ